MSHRYSHLLSRGQIGEMELRNRIVLAGMGTNFASTDGHCTEQLIAYYEARAKGGAGLLVLETSAAMWPNGASMPNTIGFSDDAFIEGLSELTRRVHQHGTKIVAQLNHSGTKAQEDTAAGRPIPVPSPIKPSRSDMVKVLTPDELANFIKGAAADGSGPKYYEMTHEHIAEITQGFASAAARARQAGFDGVELHAAHGYLLANFLSPYTNSREDSYGGSAINRARFLLETIAAVRTATAPDFAIIVRLDAHEFRVEGGITLPDCLETSRLCEQAGADAIDVSAYGNVAHSITFTEAPLVHEPNGFLPYAIAVKQAVSIPVIAVGRVEPETGDKGISSGHFDFLAMGRKLLADPDLPNKLAAGREKSVRPCIYCYICVSQIFVNNPVCCAVNHTTGREYEGDILARTGTPERVLVIGGGPAGMESARLLAEKGHEVSLWEKDPDLGGTARIAALAYEPNEKLVHYLANAVRALPISIQLGKTATHDNIAALNPDHVILATGAKRLAPEITGKAQRHVFDGDELRGILFGNNQKAIAKLSTLQRLILKMGQLSQMLRNIRLMRMLSKLWMPIASEVVIIGGGLVGLELAEYLVERRRKVTVLEPGSAFGSELSIVRRARVLHMLETHGATLHKSVENLDIGRNAVKYSLDGVAQEKACEQVIIAMGAQPDDSLLKQLSDSDMCIHQIGDCRGIGYIDGAILDARQLVQSMEMGA